MNHESTPFAATLSFRLAVTLSTIVITGCSGGGGGGGGGVSANPDSYVVSDNQPNRVLNVGAPGVLANDSGGLLTASMVTGTSCGNLSLNANGSFNYTHTATGGACAISDSFTYQATDGSQSATTTVTLNINQPPVANQGCDFTALNQNLNGTLPATDPEGQSLTYSIVPGSSGTKGIATITDPLTGAFVYAPNTNSRGTDLFTYEVSDGNLTAQGTYKIVYTPRIMALGDSITLGKNNSANPPVGQRVGYRLPIKTALANAGYQIDFVGTLNDGAGAGLFDEQHEGHGGCTAAELVAGVDGISCSAGQGTPGTKLSDWLNADKPDVVLLHIGTNELSNGSNPNTVWSDVDSILTEINNWESSGGWPVTVVMSRIINRFPADPAWVTYNTNVINNVFTPHKNAGDQVIWVNQETALTVAGDYGDTIPGPGIHPSSAGYQKMTSRWLWPLTGDNNIGTQSGSHSGAGILPKCP